MRLDGRGTLEEQISRSVRRDVLEGRFRPGARLPSTRTPARELGVSRNTVQAAYDELSAEGCLTSAVEASSGATRSSSTVVPAKLEQPESASTWPSSLTSLMLTPA